MKIFKYAKTILLDQERKPLPNIFIEALHCTFIEREIPLHYFWYLLHKINSNNYKDYISLNRVRKIENDFFHSRGRNPTLKNKLLFHDLLTMHKIRTPKILAFTNQHNICIKKRSITLRDARELRTFLTDLIDQATANSIFIKPIDSLGGQNTFKFDSRTIKSENKVKELFAKMEKVNFIFQETIQQHQGLDKIYSNSINTVRVHSFYNRKDHNAELVSALMRFGSKGSIVDGGRFGGFFVPVDMDKWELEGIGRAFLKFGGKSFSSHPDTKVRFQGIKIPYGERIEEMILQAAALFSNDFIGWDVAISHDGPIVIEGNDSPHLVMAQISCGGFKKHPKYQSIFSDYIH